MKINCKKAVLLALAAPLIGAQTYQAYAQESFGGLPPSFTAPKSELRGAEAINIVRVAPDFNAQDLKTLNEWGTNSIHFKPLRVGQVVETSIDFAKEAKRTTLESGKEVYRLAISSPGAKALSITYKDFFIPNDGGKLFIYNTNKSALLGAYTNETHPKHGVFSTEPLKGNEVILEYVPGRRNEMPSLLIDGIGHIVYSHVGLGSLTKKFFDPGEDNSDPLCQIGVNCKQGAEWQTEKTGVVQIVMYETEDGKVSLGCCSGNLLNNTNLDFAPYILTAAHCITGDNDKPLTSQADLDKWVFRFNYEKPTCSNGAEALSRGKSIIGCTVKSYLPIVEGKGVPKSDGMLLLANTEVPKNYRVYYNGWDRITARPKGRIVGIHHPSGDAKKISVSDSPIEISTWDVFGALGGRGDHFLVTFTEGDTEGGSSGSSIFDQNHLVVGTLTGGRSKCGDYPNYYGRLSRHWDNYKDPSNPLSSMDIYLDPKTKGDAETLAGTWRENLKPLEGISGLTIKLTDNEKIQVSWKGVDKKNLPSEWKLQYRVYRNGVLVKELGETDELSFTETRTEALNGSNREGGVVYGVQVRYNYNGLTIPDDGFNNGKAYTYGDSDIAERGLYLGKLIETVPVEVSANGSNGVNLTWKAPSYLQEISLFGYPKNMQLGTYARPKCEMKGRWNTPDRYRLVQRMPSDKFVGEKAPCIYAVRLIPDTKAKGKYSICIRNGVEYNKIKDTNVGKLYEQIFDVPDTWKEGEWLTVTLDKPFQFDPMQDLFVGCGSPNDDAPIGIAYVKDSDNEIRRYLDAFLLVNGMQHPVPEDYYRGSTPPEAYHAIRVVFSSTPDVEKKEDFECFAKAVSPVTFPVVKEYKVLKNGVEVAKGLKATTYQDATGSTSDKYEVKVSYETELATEGIDTNTPAVFPTQLGSNSTLYLKNAQEVAQLSVYSMDGARLVQISNPQESVDLSQLSEGVFIVVLETANQRISQRITVLKK